MMRASLGSDGHQPTARFQKGLPVHGLTGVRPTTPKSGLQKARVSGRFAWTDEVWRQKFVIDQYVDPKARFAGSNPRWAAIASLVETCEANGVGPQRTFTVLLTRLVNGWPNNRIDELMPWRWTNTEAVPSAINP